MFYMWSWREEKAKKSKSIEGLVFSGYSGQRDNQREERALLQLCNTLAQIPMRAALTIGTDIDNWERLGSIDKVDWQPGSEVLYPMAFLFNNVGTAIKTITLNTIRTVKLTMAVSLAAITSFTFYPLALCAKFLGEVHHQCVRVLGAIFNKLGLSRSTADSRLRPVGSFWFNERGAIQIHKGSPASSEDQQESRVQGNDEPQENGSNMLLHDATYINTNNLA